MRLLPVLLAACGSGGDPGAACDPTADRCEGPDICVLGTCAAAFPLPYQAFQVHAMAPEPHDLQVIFALGRAGDPPGIAATSPVAAGQTDAMFDGPFFLELEDESDTLLAELVDATTGDLLLACARSPIDLDRLRRRDDNCDKGGYWLSYEIVPAIADAYR